MPSLYVDELDIVPYSMTIIFDYLKVESAPFVVGPVNILLERGVGDWLVIELPKIPRFEFRYDLLTSDMLGTRNIEDYYHRIGRAAAQCFRAIRIEPETNIELGEN